MFELLSGHLRFFAGGSRITPAWPPAVQPAGQAGQRDEIAAGQVQQRHGRSKFLERQSRPLEQEIHLIHRHRFLKALVTALAMDA
jgi:hypothetical protein